MIYTTLNQILAQGPCGQSAEEGEPLTGWLKLLAYLGKTEADDEPLSYVTILDSNGLDDALWCCRAEPGQAALWRHFAVDCAESVRHLMTDKRSIAAMEVARRHADGDATDEELDAARYAARDAARDAAGYAAWAAAGYAARDAARDAAGYAAGYAARAAAGDALGSRFRHLVTVGAWSPRNT